MLFLHILGWMIFLSRYNPTPKELVIKPQIQFQLLLVNTMNRKITLLGWTGDKRILSEYSKINQSTLDVPIVMFQEISIYIMQNNIRTSYSCLSLGKIPESVQPVKKTHYRVL